MASKNDNDNHGNGSGDLSPDDSHDLPMSSPRETELGGGAGSTPPSDPNPGPNPVNIPTGSDLSGTEARDLPMAGPLYTNEGKSWGDELAAPGAVLMLSPGQVLANRYEIKQRIGAGGMGAVFSAYDKVRDEDIAIKVLLPKLLENPAAKERFLNEAKIASSLSHPNIVNVFDIQQDGNFTFITMELLKGGNLRDEIVRRQEKEQRFTIDEVRNIADQLCDALSHAHKQTVHRDVKPENIWLCEDGTIKLMDFGIARLMRASQFTSTGLSMGTAYYMAPEQLKGAKDIDHRADQYSVGVLLYELLTGEIPQGRFEDPHTIRKSIPLGLSNAILTALEGTASKRHADIAALKKSLAGKGGRTSTKGSGKPFPKKVAIAALILIAIGIGATYPQWKTPAYRWYKTAMAGEIVSKAEEARNLARARQQEWQTIASTLPVELENQDLAQNAERAKTAMQQAVTALEHLDYASARTMFTEATALYGESVEACQGNLKDLYFAARGPIENLEKKVVALQRDIPAAAEAARKNRLQIEERLTGERDEAKRRLYQERFDKAERDLEIAEKLAALWDQHPERDRWDSDAQSALSRAQSQERDRRYSEALQSLGEANDSLRLPLDWQKRGKQALKDVQQSRQQLESVLADYEGSAEKELFAWPMEQIAKAEQRMGQSNWDAVDSLLKKVSEGLTQVEQAIDLRRVALSAGREASVCQSIETLRVDYRAVAARIDEGGRFVVGGHFDDGDSVYREASASYDALYARAIENIDGLVAACRSKLSSVEYDQAIELADQVLAIESGHREATGLRREARIGSLLATAKSNDSEENGENKALPALASLLDLDPYHAEALALQKKIQGYYTPLQITLDLGGGTTMELVLIPSGSFLMGSPDSEEYHESNEGPQHRVRISEPYYMGKYEVTQGQWRAVMGENPSSFDDCGLDCPVERVSWDDCQSFCRKLSSRTGRTVRLPTEAEWEYACRAGTTSPFHFGGTISTNQANYDGNYTYGNGREGVYRETTISVGSLASNAWGLYDMHGNVREWCSDWYASDYYGRSAGTDPSGPSSGERRVFRGGSWYYYPRNCRSAYRLRYSPVLRSNNSGLRVVVSVGGRSGTP